MLSVCPLQLPLCTACKHAPTPSHTGFEVLRLLMTGLCIERFRVQMWSAAWWQDLSDSHVSHDYCACLKPYLACVLPANACNETPKDLEVLQLFVSQNDDVILATHDRQDVMWNCNAGISVACVQTVRTRQQAGACQHDCGVQSDQPGSSVLQ